MTPNHLRFLIYSSLFNSSIFVTSSAQDLLNGESLSDMIVLGERQVSNTTSFQQWDFEQIQLRNSSSVDSILQSSPSFSLFRRQSATFVNPTAAGISLNNVGATAASRSLVLLDGIPQNDPFGGWINWVRYPQSQLDSIRIEPSASSTQWGNLAAAGTIHLRSRTIEKTQHVLDISGGAFATYGASLWSDFVVNDSLALRIGAFANESDGFFTIRPNERGLVDRRLSLENQGLNLKAEWQIDPEYFLETHFSYYNEERVNGTALTGNETEALDFSLRVTKDSDDFSWQALAYIQDREFSSSFSSVAGDRNSERPALDQFSVPGIGIGGGWNGKWQQNESLSIQAGIDARYLDGETNESAGFVNGSFVRGRQAGGEQWTLGAFVGSQWEPSEQWTLDGSLRLDYWRLENGIRQERSLRSGASLLDNNPEDRDGWEPSASLRLSHELNDTSTIWLGASTSFRLPNLNELHRPFRVGNDVTEANSELEPERFYTLEAGYEWKNDQWSFSGRAFHHWVRDAIANTPVTDPQQISDIFGRLPTGGSGNQRRNIDEARIYGINLRGEFNWSENNSIYAEGLYSLSKFTESTTQPLLENLRFAQSPELRILGGTEIQLHPRLRTGAEVEYVSSVFDDGLATERLPDYWNSRLFLSWQFNEKLLLRAQIENLFDEEIITGVRNDLETLGQPRSFLISARYTF